MRFPIAGASALAALAILAAPGAASAATFVVDRFDDTDNPGVTDVCQVPGLNDCTLRGAIRNANLDGTKDVISFADAQGTYLRDGAGAALEITSPVEIAGRGARATVLRGTAPFAGGPVLAFSAGADQSEVHDLTVTAGLVANSGGGIESRDATLFFNRVTVSGNTAFGFDFFGFAVPAVGGGVYFSGNGKSLALSGSTISGNSAVGGTAPAAGRVGQGGGVFVDSNASLSVSRSTIAGNVADGDGGSALGGGLSAVTGANVSLSRSTVAGNVAEDAGAGQRAVANVWRDAGSLISARQAIVGEPLPAGVEDCSVALSLATFSVSDSGSCLPADPTNRPSAMLALGALQDNGGPTDTRAITQASAAFEIGGSPCEGRDQRGFGIPGFDVCDAGAFELQGSFPPGGGGGGGDAGGGGESGGDGGGAGADGGVGPTRAVTLRYSGRSDRFRGALKSSDPACEAGRVKVFEKRKGKDPKVGSDRTSANGRWSFDEPNAEGRFFATVAELTIPAGTCPTARSRTKRVR